MKLGDMHVAETPPAKLIKALAVIAGWLHPAYDEVVEDELKGHSKISCIFSSLVVRGS